MWFNKKKKERKRIDSWSLYIIFGKGDYIYKNFEIEKEAIKERDRILKEIRKGKIFEIRNKERINFINPVSISSIYITKEHYYITEI